MLQIKDAYPKMLIAKTGHDMYQKEGIQTIYARTGNWFPWMCVVFVLVALFTGTIGSKMKTIPLGHIA